MRQRTRATTSGRLGWIPLLALALALGAAANAQADVVVDKPSLTFSAQADAISAPKEVVTLTNTGAAPVTITALTKTSNPLPKGAEFGVLRGTCQPPKPLAPMETCAFQVDYRPTRPTPPGTPHTGTVNVGVDNAPPVPKINLSGTATPSPQRASFAPATLTFGPQGAGSTSVAQTVKARNSGNAPLVVSDVAITGANARDFAISAQDCRGRTLAAEDVADDSCTVSVTFTPTATGARTATLHFTDDAADTPDDVALTGTGTTRVAGTIGTKPLNAKIRGLWKVGARSTRMRSLSVITAVRSRIEVRCSGKRGACSFRTKTIKATATRATNLAKFFRRRAVPTGTTITVFVTRAGRVGTYKRFVTRSGRRQPATTTRCLDAGLKPITCS